MAELVNGIKKGFSDVKFMSLLIMLIAQLGATLIYGYQFGIIVGTLQTEMRTVTRQVDKNQTKLERVSEEQAKRTGIDYGRRLDKGSGP